MTHGRENSSPWASIIFSLIFFQINDRDIHPNFTTTMGEELRACFSSPALHFRMKRRAKVAARPSARSIRRKNHNILLYFSSGLVENFWLSELASRSLLFLTRGSCATSLRDDIRERERKERHIFWWWSPPPQQIFFWCVSYFLPRTRRYTVIIKAM